MKQRDELEAGSVLNNLLSVVAAPEEAMQRFVESLRPVLRRAGGMCLVSDARWLKH